jgi:hypothetical protein
VDGEVKVDCEASGALTSAVPDLSGDVARLLRATPRGGAGNAAPRTRMTSCLIATGDCDSSGAHQTYGHSGRRAIAL